MRYVIRTEPASATLWCRRSSANYRKANLNRAIVWVRPHTYFTERSYRADSRMVAFLGVLIVNPISQ